MTARWTPPPADLCPATGDQHRWYAPVVQSPPDHNYRGWSYHIRGGLVRGATVRCWDCGRAAPTGYGEGGKELEG